MPGVGTTAALAGLLMLFPGLPSPSDVVGPDSAFVDPELLKLFHDDPSQVAILVLDPAQESRVIEELERRGDVYHRYPQLHMVALVTDRDGVDHYARVDGVTTIWRNERAHTMLDRSADYVGANLLWKNYGVTGRQKDGKPVGIMIVDTGIDGTHPDVKFGQNLVENVVPTRSSNPVADSLVGGSQEGVVNSDYDGHGTHVAGIAGGTAKGGSSNEYGKFKGMAYQAVLIGFAAGQVEQGGEASFQSVAILEAFNYALEKKSVHNIRVVSNSWGANGNWEPANPVNQASLNLYRAGLVVTFAAGNEGADGEGTLNKYSVAPWVLSVAAGNYVNQRASFSSMGYGDKPYDHPDIMAPGVQITAPKAISGDTTGGLLPGGTTATRAGYYSAKSGTSMATPHVSGVAALLISANPKLSPDDVYDILIQGSTPLPGVKLEHGGAGYLNALESYKISRGVAGNLDDFLRGKIKYGGKLVGDLDFSEDPVSVGLGKVGTGGEAPTLAAAGRLLTSLVSTTQGVIFLVGTALLTLFSFRLRKGVPTDGS